MTTTASKIDRYSDSAIATYKGCPLRFKYQKVDGLQLIQGAPRHDMDYGAAIHEALAVLYSEKGTVRLAQDAFATAYPSSDYPNELPAWSQGKSFANGIAAIAGYARHWYEDDLNWDVVDVEQLHEVVDQAETSRVVKLDLIVCDKRDGQIYGVDHKATGKYISGQSGRSFWDQFEPHSQIRAYTQHIKERYGHCGGFYINALSFKHRAKAYTPRKGPNKGISLPAGDWFDFARVLFHPNEDCLLLEQQNLAYWTHRIEHDADLGIFGYNTNECHRGGATCEYWRACSAGWTWPGDEELLRSYYRQVCLGLIDGDSRCQLDRGHQGPHSPDAPKPEAIDYEVALDEQEENAEA